MSARQLFVTGIGTGVGKTIVSAVFVQYLRSGYWKPVQSGDLHLSDSMRVRSMVDTQLTIYPERHQLQLAASPHQSAAEENRLISIDDFDLPTTSGNLIVEGAGGLFVPLNDQDFMIDLIGRFRLPVVLVVRNYLGCINHTLLSVHALQSRGIAIAYLVFNGDFPAATRDIISKHLPLDTIVVALPEIMTFTREQIRLAASALQQQIHPHAYESTGRITS